MRAANVALFIGLLGGLWLATAVLSTAGHRPATVAAALGLAHEPSLGARQARAVAVLTAECMARLGLTWSVVPEPMPHIPDRDLDPIAWADRWGFGVSTMLDRSPAAGNQDANATRVAGLPAAARTTYISALHGSPGRPGCHETANEAVFGLRDRLLKPIRAELDALDAAIAADRGVAMALSAWRDCVTGVSGGLTIDRRSLPSALIRRFLSRAGAITRRSALNDLRLEERRIAGVMARCEESYGAARARVAARHEAAFVATYGEALRAIGAAIRAAEAALPRLQP